MDKPPRAEATPFSQSMLSESAALVAVHTADLAMEPTHHLTQQLSQKTFPRKIKDGVNLEDWKDLAKQCWGALSDQTYKRRRRTVAPWCLGLHLSNLS